MWTVIILDKAKKVFKKYLFLERRMKLLVEYLTIKGPYLPEWSHFGKLKNGSGLYHCHLNNNSPVMIALWMVINEEKREMEVKDVQTHQEFDSKN